MTNKNGLVGNRYSIGILCRFRCNVSLEVTVFPPDVSSGGSLSLPTWRLMVSQSCRKISLPWFVEKL